MTFGQIYQIQELPKAQLAEITCMCSSALYSLGSHLTLMQAEATEENHPTGLKYSLVGRSLLLPYFTQYRPESMEVFLLTPPQKVP